MRSEAEPKRSEAAAFDVDVAFDLPHLEAAVKMAQETDKKRGLSERSEFAPFPVSCVIFVGTPKGRPSAVAFLCLLSLAKQRK